MYSFKLNIGNLSNPVKGNGYIEVSVLSDGNGIVKYRDNDYFGIVRKKIKNELLFINQEYKALKKLSDNGEINIELKVYLNSVEKFYGYLLLDGTWDDHKKTCSLITQPIDEYSKFLNNLDKEVNIIDFADNTVKIKRYSTVQRVTLPCFNGNVSEAKAYYDPDGNISSNPMSSSPDWNYYIYEGEESGCAPGYHAYKFVTLKADFAAPGYTASVIFSNLWLKAGSTAEIIYTDIERAAKLYDVLEALINLADNTINISQLTYSDYINDSNNYIYNLFIMDKSDVKRNSSNPATYQNISLKRLLDLYMDLFELSYKIEDSTFYFVRKGDLSEPDYGIHPTHDFTTYKGIDPTKNQRIFTTNTENKTSKEILKFEEVTGIHFVKSELDYQLYFDNKKEYSYLDFNNNVRDLVNDWEEANDDGFTLISCDNTNSIFNRTVLDGNILINGGMSAQLIFYDHKRQNRPFQNGLLDNHIVELSREKDREVNYNDIIIYDIDLIDFNYLVKTSFGLIEISEFEISFKGNFGSVKGYLQNEFASGLLYEITFLYSSLESLICSESDPPAEVTKYNTENSHSSGRLYNNPEGTIIAPNGYYKHEIIKVGVVVSAPYYYFNGIQLTYVGNCI